MRLAVAGGAADKRAGGPGRGAGRSETGRALGALSARRWAERGKRRDARPTGRDRAAGERSRPGWAERKERERCCGLGLELGWAALDWFSSLGFWAGLQGFGLGSQGLGFILIPIQTKLIFFEFKFKFEFNTNTQTIKRDAPA